MRPDIPSDIRPRALLVMRIFAVLLPLLGAALWGWVAWRDMTGIATRHAAAQVELVAQHMERMIQTQEVIHQAVRARARIPPVGGLESERFHRFLVELDGNRRFGRGILVVDLSGRVVASSRVFPISLVMPDRDYIAALRGGAPFFVDRMKVAPSGADAFVVATRLQTEGFDGLIVSGFDTEDVARYLRGISQRPFEAASVMRTDGKLLVRSIESDPVVLPPDAPGRTTPSTAPEGHFVAEAVTDGIRRIYAFTHLGNLPLVAFFGVPTDVVWRDWAARTLPVFAFFALTALFAYLSADRIRRDLTARFEAEENRKRVAEAERLAEERIRLMRETNHRVKNNLALVVSLINMQMRGAGGIDGAELKMRIGAISHVHDLMYQAADAVHVDFGGLLRDIATSPALVPHERGLSVDCEIESGILLGPDRTTPLALIVAELVTNAVKHAFRDGRRGTIRVALRRDGDEASLTVADDGVGLSQGAERRSGSAIVDALVEQIGATLTRGIGPGASFNLRFRTD